MKPLEQLTNVERAKLLHELFPNEIPGFVKFTKSMVVTVLEEQELIRAKWENQLFTFDFWLSLAKEVGGRIDKFGKNLERSRFVFSDQLFEGYNALFMTHCLEQYAKTLTPDSKKFGQAIELLFT